MTHTITVPNNLFEASSKANNFSPPISNELVQEVEKQLLRKFMEKCGGKLNLVDAVSLYANNVEGICTINAAKTNLNGDENRNPNNFGNIYEALEVFANNKESIVNDTGIRASRTDDLAQSKKQGKLKHEALDLYAQLYDQHTDVVIYNEDGKVQQTQQLKHTRGTAILMDEKYTSHENAPNVIVVPPDMYDRHKEKLEKIIEKTSNPDTRERAQIALKKLQAGHVNSEWTSHADKDNNSFLAYVIEKTGGETGILAKNTPYLYVAKEMTTDVTKRVGGRVHAATTAELGSLIVGGAVWELRDAFKSPNQLSFIERIKRLFSTVLINLKAKLKDRGYREIALESMTVILGLLKGVCKSFSAFLSFIGSSLQQVWDSIYDYFTGKISSFSQLITIVSKVLATVGIGALALVLEKKLTVMGIPSVISGLLAAALAGVAIVFVNRGIDALIFAVTSAFSQARAAELRREKIKAYCENVIPHLISERKSFEKMVNMYYEKRNNIMTDAFNSLRGASITHDTLTVYASLEKINKLYGHSLGWKTQKEFDDIMFDDTPIVL